jgi:iron complex transport system permease protein
VFTGPVAFIGLAVPHIARLILQTSDIRKLLPTVVVLGSLITTLCDLCARVVMKPVELPISAVTSLLGAPIIIFLLLRRRSEYA